MLATLVVELAHLEPAPVPGAVREPHLRELHAVDALPGLKFKNKIVFFKNLGGNGCFAFFTTSSSGFTPLGALACMDLKSWKKYSLL